jgi:membrane protease YdiL (CAAX protease family)
MAHRSGDTGHPSGRGFVAPQGRAESDPAPEPPVDLPVGVLREEIIVVLSLSLLASAVYAIIDLLSAPVSGITRVVYPQVGLATQLAEIAFGLAPVWLVLHLLRRDRETPASIGLTRDPPLLALGSGALIALVVGTVGFGVYLLSVALGINRFVVPVPPIGHWWTIPILILGSIAAALLEEVVVIGYLITKLRRIGWGVVAAVSLSALLRASYHLYQGLGGFIGNLALGLFFGWLFVRRKRLWPLIIAHFLVDLAAGVGYLLFRNHLPGVA